MLVGISHDEPDGRSGGFSLEDTAQQLHFVSFFSAGREFTLTGTASGQFRLNEVDVDVYSGRHAVYDSSYCLSVALAKRGQRENITKSIAHSVMNYKIGRAHV